MTIKSAMKISMKSQLIMFLVSIFCSATVTAKDLTAAEAQSFNQYWDKFRQAIVNENLDEVTKLTQFPFQTRGTNGSDSTVKYDKSSFITIFKKIIDQKIYAFNNQQLVPLSMKEVVANAENISKEHLIKDDLARVEQFTFVKIGGHWYFERAYISDLEQEMAKSQNSSLWAKY